MTGDASRLTKLLNAQRETDCSAGSEPCHRWWIRWKICNDPPSVAQLRPISRSFPALYDPAFSTRSYAVSEQIIRSNLQAQFAWLKSVPFAGDSFPQWICLLPRFYWPISRRRDQPAASLAMPFQSLFQDFPVQSFCAPFSSLPSPASEL